MKYRLEAAKGSPSTWAWFLRTAKKHPGYSVLRDGAFDIHVVETNEPETMLALWMMVRPCKHLALYVDGILVSPTRFGFIMAQGERTKRMLNRIVERKEAEFDKAKKIRRWRMGLGPDPEMGF